MDILYVLLIVHIFILKSNLYQLNNNMYNIGTFILDLTIFKA